jgi:hypothetical protein
MPIHLDSHPCRPATAKELCRRLDSASEITRVFEKARNEFQWLPKDEVDEVKRMVS